MGQKVERTDLIYTLGGLGDYLIASCKMIMDGIDFSNVHRKHGDNGQQIHRQNIEYLSSFFFHEKKFEWESVKGNDDKRSYITNGEDQYTNYDKVREYFPELNDNYIVIQSEAGTNSFSAHETRTWNNIDINKIIDFFSKKMKIVIIGNSVGQVTSKNCKYLINDNLMIAMNMVYNAKLFIGFDGFLSYIRSYTGKKQLVRHNKNYDVYYSNNQKQFTKPFNDTKELLTLIKEVI